MVTSDDPGLATHNTFSFMGEKAMHEADNAKIEAELSNRQSKVALVRSSQAVLLSLFACSLAFLAVLIAIAVAIFS